MFIYIITNRLLTISESSSDPVISMSDSSSSSDSKSSDSVSEFSEITSSFFLALLLVTFPIFPSCWSLESFLTTASTVALLGSFISTHGPQISTPHMVMSLTQKRENWGVFHFEFQTSLFVAFRRFSFFNQGYYIEVISKTFSSCLTLTHFLIFLQPLKIVVYVFFLLDQKVGLTARNHSTYSKLQSNICLKLFVLEPIKENKNNYFRGWGRYKNFLKSRFFKLTLSKILLQGRKSHNPS